MRTATTRWGANLQRLMRERGLTQGEVARRAGLNPNALSRIVIAESVKSTTLEALAGAIGVDVSALFVPLERDRDLIRHAPLVEQAPGQQEVHGADSPLGVLTINYEQRVLLAEELRGAIHALSVLAHSLVPTAAAPQAAPSGSRRHRRAAGE